MITKLNKYGLLGIKILVGLAFLVAGLAKLAGVETMVDTFEIVGLGQWFRYITGLIEISAAVLLFVPGVQILGAGLLVCTMIGAVIAHLTVLGPSPVPALILGLLSSVILFSHRKQLPFG